MGTFNLWPATYEWCCKVLGPTNNRYGGQISAARHVFQNYVVTRQKLFDAAAALGGVPAVFDLLDAAEETDKVPLRTEVLNAYARAR